MSALSSGGVFCNTFSIVFEILLNGSKKIFLISSCETLIFRGNPVTISLPFAYVNTLPGNTSLTVPTSSLILCAVFLPIRIPCSYCK